MYKNKNQGLFNIRIVMAIVLKIMLVKENIINYKRTKVNKILLSLYLCLHQLLKLLCQLLNIDQSLKIIFKCQEFKILNLSRSINQKPKQEYLEYLIMNLKQVLKLLIDIWQTRCSLCLQMLLFQMGQLRRIFIQIQKETNNQTMILIKMKNFNFQRKNKNC